MNKHFFISFIFIALFYLTGQSQPTGEKWKRKGVVIDSSVSIEAKKRIKKGDFSNRLDVSLYENDVKQKLPLLSGENVPHNVVNISPNDDTLRILITHLLGMTYGFEIEKTKDTCAFSHYAITRSSSGSYKLHADDSSYQSSIKVPAVFYLVLDKEGYKAGEPIYGYIEAVTEEFYSVHYANGTKDKDMKKKIELSGYFIYKP